MKQIELARKKLFADTVKSEVVWKNCHVDILVIDEKLDREYIERMFMSYLSGIAKFLSEEEKIGEYEIALVLDGQGRVTNLEVQRDSFQSDQVKQNIVSFLQGLNYGANDEIEEAPMVLLIRRDKLNPPVKQR